MWLYNLSSLRSNRPPSSELFNCLITCCLLLLEYLHHLKIGLLSRLFSNGYATPPNDCWCVALMGSVQPLLRLSSWGYSWFNPHGGWFHPLHGCDHWSVERVLLPSCYSCRACTLGASMLGAVKICTFRQVQLLNLSKSEPLIDANWSKCLTFKCGCVFV